MHRRTARGEQGFTLVELLVVILVVGVLASIALAAFLNQAGKGADATARANLRSSATKVEACAAERGTYVGCDTAATLAAGDFPVTATEVTATGCTLSVVKAATGPTSRMTATHAVTAADGRVGAIS